MAIDAFEAAHPGLVDNTEHCARCKSPTYRSHSAHGLFDNEELFEAVFGTDHDAYDKLYCIPLCDQCFAEMKAEQEWHAADVRPLVDRYCAKEANDERLYAQNDDGSVSYA
jgi:hypothetical protein